MTTAAPLLRTLESAGPRPVLAWYGEAARIELSGHVLANWVIKAIGHLDDEVDLAPGDLVVLDLPPHWKRLVLALAAWSLGAEVRLGERAEDDGNDDSAGDVLAGGAEPRVVVTDRPDSALADSADEVLAVQPVSLAPRYDGDLPPLVRDWVVEVRGSSDRLGVALPGWSGPALDRSDASRTGPEGTPPRLLVEGDGLAVAAQVLAAWGAGGGIVGPAAQVTERQRADEAITAQV